MQHSADPVNTRHLGTRLAEIGFLLILFAGVWLAAAQVAQFRFGTARTIVSGVALALALYFSSLPRAGVGRAAGGARGAGRGTRTTPGQGLLHVVEAAVFG